MCSWVKKKITCCIDNRCKNGDFDHLYDALSRDFQLINFQDDNGLSIPMHAIKICPEQINVILKYETDIDLKSKYGMTILMMAIKASTSNSSWNAIRMSTKRTSMALL